MNTSGLSSHTPLAGVIKWAWLDILHLTDAFDVVRCPMFLSDPAPLWYLNYDFCCIEQYELYWLKDVRY